MYATNVLCRQAPAGFGVGTDYMSTLDYWTVTDCAAELDKGWPRPFWTKVDATHTWEIGDDHSGQGPRTYWYVTWTNQVDVIARFMNGTVFLVDSAKPDMLAELRALPTAYDQEQYADNMSEVERMTRKYNEDGIICDDGTNKFLRHFGWSEVETACERGECEESDCDECRPSTTYTVDVTVTLTITVDSREDEDYILDNVRENVEVTGTSYVDGYYSASSQTVEAEISS